MGGPPHPNPLPKAARGLYGAVGGFNAGFCPLLKGERDCTVRLVGLMQGFALS